MGQRQTDQATAAAAENERLVAKARQFDLQRAELQEAEGALQAQRTQAQQGEFCTAIIMLIKRRYESLMIASGMFYLFSASAVLLRAHVPLGPSPATELLFVLALPDTVLRRV